MPSLHDTRLLTNLLKTEKDASNSFKAWTKDAASASSALVAWSTADSQDTQDLMDASHHLATLNANVSDSQNRYLAALASYRHSLKDVLEREASIKVIIRDREILVSRVMKLGNQKPKDGKREAWDVKVQDAQAELKACETFLQEEEVALSGVKRRTFREALSMRMNAMGDLGRTMDASSREAVELLSSLGMGANYAGSTYQLEEHAHGSVAGDSITPSHSASQAQSDSDDDSEYGEEEETAALPSHMSVEPAAPQRSISPQPAPRATSPRPPPVDRRLSILSTSTTGSARRKSPSRERAPPMPRPVMPAVPTAPRNSILINGGMPSIDIPKAPTNVMTRRPDQDSSDEEDERAFQRRTTSEVQFSNGQRGGYEAGSASGGRLRKKAMSDTSSMNEYGSRPRRNSFFGGIASLFRSKKKSEEPSVRSMPTSPLSSNWDTRTDKHVFAAQRSGSTNFIPPDQRPKKAQREESSDDETPKNVVRNVNDPAAFRRRTLSIAEPPVTKKTKKVKKAASDIGVATSYSAPSSGVVAGVPQLGTLRKAESINDVNLAAKKTIKKKKKPVEEEKYTAVMIVPGPNDVIPGAPAKSTGVSRSNTITSTKTTGTNGTIKKKKVKSPLSASSLPPSPSLPAPDLSASLPSSTIHIPQPVSLETSLPSAAVSRRTSTYAGVRSNIIVEPNHENEHYGDNGTLGGPGKVPKSLKENERKAKEEEMRLGNENWVNHGEGVKKKKTVKKAKAPHAAEGDANPSLMALVESTSTPSDVPVSRSYAKMGATLRPPTANMSDSTNSLTKRKSVRLADGPSPDDGTLHAPAPRSQSPASSVRSGILVNATPAPVQVRGEGWKGKEREIEPDTSDSEQGDGDEYKQARKAFAKETKGWEKALKGDVAV